MKNALQRIAKQGPRLAGALGVVAGGGLLVYGGMNSIYSGTVTPVPHPVLGGPLPFLPLLP